MKFHTGAIIAAVVALAAPSDAVQASPQDRLRADLDRLSNDVPHGSRIQGFADHLRRSAMNAADTVRNAAEDFRAPDNRGARKSLEANREWFGSLKAYLQEGGPVPEGIHASDKIAVTVTDDLYGEGVVVPEFPEAAGRLVIAVPTESVRDFTWNPSSTSQPNHEMLTRVESQPADGSPAHKPNLPPVTIGEGGVAELAEDPASAAPAENEISDMLLQLDTELARKSLGHTARNSAEAHLDADFGGIPSLAFLSTEARFEGSEHARSADKAELSGLTNSDPTQLLTMENGLEVTYGQIIALAGDFYADEIPMSTSKDANKAFGNAFNNLAKKAASAREGRTIVGILKDEEKKTMNKPDPAKAFADLGESMNGRYNQATGGGKYMLPQGRFLRLAAMNWDHFSPENRIAYNAGHTAAMETAKRAKSLSGAAQQREMMKAYAQNAFADHFLTDMFSSGHMRCPRLALDEGSWGRTIGGLLAKMIHDEDNSNGLNAKDGLGDHWVAMGDKNFHTKVGATNKAKIQAAVKYSVDEVTKAFETGKVETDVAKLFPEATENNNPPLFKMENGKLMRREDVDDATDNTYIDDWSAAYTLYLGQVKTRVTGEGFSSFVPPPKPRSHKLKIKVLSGHNLEDLDWVGKGDSDVRVQVQVGKHKKKTRTVESNNPRFSEGTWEFGVRGDSTIQLTVDDEDVTTWERIGRGSLSIGSLKENAPARTMTVRISHGGEFRGNVKLSVQLVTVDDSAQSRGIQETAAKAAATPSVLDAHGAEIMRRSFTNFGKTFLHQTKVVVVGDEFAGIDVDGQLQVIGKPEMIPGPVVNSHERIVSVAEMRDGSCFIDAPPNSEGPFKVRIVQYPAVSIGSMGTGFGAKISTELTLYGFPANGDIQISATTARAGGHITIGDTPNVRADASGIAKVKVEHEPGLYHYIFKSVSSPDVAEINFSLAPAVGTFGQNGRVTRLNTRRGDHHPQ